MWCGCGWWCGVGVVWVGLVVCGVLSADAVPRAPDAVPPICWMLHLLHLALVLCLTSAREPGNVTFQNLRARELHQATLHYTQLHYTKLHYSKLHYTTLHQATLHYTTLYTTPSYTTPNYTTLHYTTPSYTTLHYPTPSYTTLESTALHQTTLHYTTPPPEHPSADAAAGRTLKTQPDPGSNALRDEIRREGPHHPSL